MATYQININERMALGKNLVALLRSIPEAVSFETQVKQETQEKSEVYKSLERAFRDVRDMMDGKKREKTLDELIDELQNNSN
ncbi:hypothetical protein FACS189451_04890 [Bacteroidia bacterium]|nr:hypothetical protein FACS189451_04890 [Bacteroidia bacterium]